MRFRRLVLPFWAAMFAASTSGPARAESFSSATNTTAATVDDDDPGGYEEIGLASWYGAWHQGRRTASGARFDMRKLTAAHKTLPLDTRLRVTNLRNGRAVEVIVNDRGPYVGKRIVDLSARAAEAIGLKRRGVGRVKIEVIDDDGGAS